MQSTSTSATTAPTSDGVAHLGLLAIDVPSVLRHLKRDLRDDWYPDPLSYLECLTVDFIRDRIAALQSNPAQGYQPTIRVVRDVPKQGGTLRYSLETTLVDRFVYQALVEKLAHPLDALLSSRVFSHRCQTTRKEFFKPAVSQWLLFQDSIRGRGADCWIVEADIQNFYESITVEELSKNLFDGIVQSAEEPRAQEEKRYAARMLLSLLPTWCYKPTHGLPQNRDASSFLANQFLRTVDRGLEAQGWEFFRYMDDIRICVPSRDNARRALVALTRLLRDIGLTLNSRKTRIHQPGTPDHDKMMSEGDRRLRDIDNMWRSRSQATIARSLQYLSELAKDLVSRNATSDRDFRFCVNKLQQLAQARDLKIEIPERDALKAMVLQRLVEDSAVADQLCSFLGCVPLNKEERDVLEDVLLSESTYLYEWQRFHIVSLLLAKGHTSPRFLEAAERSVTNDLEDPLIPRDLALILLARDNDGWRQKIAQGYSVWCRNHIERRAGLIAVHELDYDRVLHEHVSAHVPNALKGTVLRLKSSARGTYYSGKPKVPSSTLVDLVSTYV